MLWPVEELKQMSAAQARLEASRCLFCYDAPCNQACPAHVDVAGFIRRIKTGNFQGAAELIRQENVLAEVCGYLCPARELCASGCCRSGLDQPIAIGSLQAFVGRYERLHGSIPLVSGPGEETEHRVAVIGAGPAGLAAARRLLELGYGVEIFDRNSLPGGLVAYAISPHKVDREALFFEAQLVEQAGAAFNMSTEIEEPHRLLEEFDAVVVAAGWGRSVGLGLEGESLEGVYSADSFLNAVCAAGPRGLLNELSLGDRALIFGGGNTAIDCAVAAKRLGVDRVTVVYRRTFREMPAWKDEVYRALDEGVELECLVEPTRFVGQDGQLIAVECVRTELGSLDYTGRPMAIPVPDSQFLVPASSVVVAVGYKMHRWAVEHQEDPSFPPDHVFLSDEMIACRGTVVDAVASGKEVAEVVHDQLSESGIGRGGHDEGRLSTD
jgi:dihydropyrimidine dehydrogenase (NAD+) subunit PreT